MEIKLGTEYKDEITGIKGVATAVTTYLYGCRRVCLETKERNSEQMEYWFDEQRLISQSKAPKGGPWAIPTNRSVPTKR